MKRPSGFDRAPEPRRTEIPVPEPERGNPGAGGGSAPRAEADSGSHAAERSSLLNRRLAARAQEAARFAETARAEDAERTARPVPTAPGAPAEADEAKPVIWAAPAAELIGDDEERVDGPGDGSAGAESASTRATGSVNGAMDEDIGEDPDAHATDVLPRTGGGILGVRRGRPVDSVRAAEKRVREAARLVKKRQKREKRRFSAHARRRRRNWLVSGGAVIALALFVVAGVFTPIMAVKNVQLVGAHAVDSEKVQHALQRFEGTPLALVDGADVHRVLEPFPLIQRYAVELQPPHTLVVRIEERVPVIARKRGDIYELYDAAAVLVGREDAKPTSVPLGDGAVKDLSSDAFTAAARALHDMPDELRAQVVTVTAKTGQDVEVELSSGIDVIWGEATESAKKALVLQTMLDALHEQGRDARVIDVSSTQTPVFR